MRKIFTLILSVMIFSAAFAQLERPTAVIKKATVKPVIDGVFDDVWATTDSLAIDRPYETANGAPTLGEPGETFWQALWDEDGFYLIVNVTDDDYWPNYSVTPAGNAWEYDKPEIYFDVNYVLEDALGPSAPNSGHHQMAPDMTAAKEDGLLSTETNGRQNAFKVTDPNYVAEYFVPWASLTDKEGITVDKTGVVGFDVTINDSDEANNIRRRSVWANDGPDANESWVNMNECGTITFLGAEPGLLVESVSITGGSITSDNQTLQIVSEVLPEDAENKSLKWTIAAAEGSSARATISSTGVITPILDGVVVVTASSSDGSFIDSDPVEVTISGQVPSVGELSYIKNGNFDVVNENGSPGAPWTGGSTVVDGVLNITNTNGQGANPWDWTVGQDVNIPESLKNEPFVLKLKMWISEADTVDVDFENIGGNYVRFGNTSDPRSADGNSQWSWAPLSTEPTMYVIAIENFADMDAANPAQKFNFFAGRTNATVYIDSVSLVSVADMALIPTAIAQNNAASFKVYPNPASSKLNIDLTTPNTTVAIYNSVGIKMEETIVNGTHHVFDVSRYTKGLYFVKANNAVVKFVK